MTGCAYPDLDPGRARTAFGLCQAASCACLAAPSSAGCVSTRTQARKHTHTKKHTQDERVCARERARARASASERGMRCRVTRARMAPGPLRTCTPCIWCGCEYIWLLPVLFRHDAPPGPPCSRACAPAQSCRARASSHAAPRSSWTPRPRAMRAIAGQPARAQMHAVAGTHMCCRGGERGRGAVSAPVGPGAVLVHPRPSAGLLPLLARTPEFQASEKKWSRHRARDQNDGPDRKDRLGTQAHPSAARRRAARHNAAPCVCRVRCGISLRPELSGKVPQMQRLSARHARAGAGRHRGGEERSAERSRRRAAASTHDAVRVPLRCVPCSRAR